MSADETFALPWLRPAIHWVDEETALNSAKPSPEVIPLLDAAPVFHALPLNVFVSVGPLAVAPTTFDHATG